MSLFQRFKKSSQPSAMPVEVATALKDAVASGAVMPGTAGVAMPGVANVAVAGGAANAMNRQNGVSELVLRTIEDGIIVTDERGVVSLMNPAALNLTGAMSDMIGMDYKLALKLEKREGEAFSDAVNPVYLAVSRGQNLERFPCTLIVSENGSVRRTPIVLSVLLSHDGWRIINFRDVTAEVAKEQEQTEFISTASHEMRTPVASIEGYLSLALNPGTATIDARARGYLDSAHKAAKHLGKLFQDLLDTTKLDDHRIAPKFRPVELVPLVREITTAHLVAAKQAELTLNFGSSEGGEGEGPQVAQKIYCSVDIDFLREILDNLLDNAIKYTPRNGSVTVNVAGENARAAIMVTDSGIGIAAEDLKHVFQKFYRADNTDTRTIGGTGLGLYLVKQRVEALGGTVTAESVLGNGSTFTVFLPRLSNAEYEKRMIAVRNEAMMQRRNNTLMTTGSPLVSTNGSNAASSLAGGLGTIGPPVASSKANVWQSITTLNGGNNE